MLFSPDGSILASASFDYSIGLWDVAACKVRYRLVRPGGRGIGTIAFSPDGRVLAADRRQRRGVIALWDVATRNIIADLPMVHAPVVNYLAFSPDGEVLASGGPEGTVILRNAATGKLYERLPHTGSISSLAYWRDGSALAASTYSGRIEVWDTSEWVRQRPERVMIVEGDGQQGAAGSALTAPFVVSVRDEHGAPFPDIPVLFTVTEGGGAVSATAVRADTSGNAATTLTLGTEVGMNTVVARAADLEPAVFTARAFGSPDVNDDGVVDFSDFVVFVQKFGTSRGDDGYDVSCDLDGDEYDRLCRLSHLRRGLRQGVVVNVRRAGCGAQWNVSRFPPSQNATTSTHFTTHPPDLSGSPCASRPVARVGASLVGARTVRKRLRRWGRHSCPPASMPTMSPRKWVYRVFGVKDNRTDGRFFGFAQNDMSCNHHWRNLSVRSWHKLSS